MSSPQETSHESAPLTADKTIARLCKLLYEVHERLDGFRDPCDCFCPERRMSPSCWRSTGEALAFVEHAVTEALRALPLRSPSNE